MASAGFPLDYQLSQLRESLLDRGYRNATHLVTCTHHYGYI